jgi:hypothetical protein
VTPHDVSVAAGDSEYVERHLCRMADEAVQEAEKAIMRIQADWTMMKALGNSRIYIAYNEEIASVLKTALLKMGKSAFAITGEHSQVVASAIAKAADQTINQVTEFMRTKAAREARVFGGRDPLLSQLTASLNKIKEAVVDDFTNGMCGGIPLKKPALSQTTPSIVNSPGAVQQYVIGNHNQLSVQQQFAPLSAAIDKLLASGEFNQLSAEHQTEIRNTADVVRGELAKSGADGSKVKWWADKLIKLVRDFGLALAADALMKAALGLSL